MTSRDRTGSQAVPGADAWPTGGIVMAPGDMAPGDMAPGDMAPGVMAPGDMAPRIRGHDWSATPLGPIATWPERLRAAVDTALGSAFATLVWWGDDLIQLYNDAAIAILRDKHPRALGQRARATWADAWPVVGPMIEEVLATGRPVRHEDLPVTLDRGGGPEQAFFTFCYSALLDQAGRIAGILITAIETTARVDAETALRQSEAQYRGLVESSATVSWVKDEDGRYVYISRNYERQFRVRLEDWKGKTDFEVWPREVAEIFRRNDLAVLAADGPIEVEETGKNPDGIDTWWLSHKFVFRDGSGKRCVGGLAVDITARKQAEAALAEINRELEGRVAERTHQLEQEMARRGEAQAALANAQRLEAIGQLAGGVAHDINNMLTVVSANLEAALSRIDDEAARKSMREGLDAVRSGASLNRRLLSFARRRRLESVSLRLSGRVDEMKDLLQRTVGELVALTTRHAADLWPTMVDPGEIDTTLLNLVINARDAMPGGGALTIETRNVTLDAAAAAGMPDATPGDYVLLRVADTGHGMPPEVLGRAIEPFFTTKGTGKGTGLGLSSVYGFARQSGGILSIASQTGKGTIVDVYLPRTEAGTAAPSAADAKAAMPRGNGELILVVEDDVLVRRATLGRLEGLGYAVLEAGNGQQAVEMLHAGAPVALVFSDVVMSGGMSGYDVARLARALRPDLKVLLTSGYSESHASRGRGADDPDLLEKPYDRQQLARAIRQALET